MNRILKIDPNVSISYSRITVDLRNKVIHAYDNINFSALWKIIIKDLPIPRQEVEQLLKD